jgi:2-oxoisovalerate dehydrogenase E2 component (dihydrolipoyl transacylase)
MSTVIVMPQLGESVAEGIIGKWLKNEGDPIQKDEPIVEIITDKVNAEIPSPVSGVLERITQPEGATVAVGQEIAVIGDGSGSGAWTGDGSGESVSVGGPAPTPASASGAPFANAPTQVVPTSPGAGNGPGPQAVAGATSETATPMSVSAPGPAPAPTADGGPQAPRSTPGERGERVRSSPLVRRIAEQYGINLSEVSGTGIGGRVSKHDILLYVQQRQRMQPPPGLEADVATEAGAQTGAGVGASPAETAGASQAPVATPAPAARQPAAPREAGPNEELIPVPALRRMIADRMALSTSTIPHATTHAEVDVSSVVRYREAKKDAFRAREGVPLSYVAFVIKATVEALKEFPMVNAEWAGESIVLKKDVNINIAVDAPDGLTTPVIHHADEKSLAGLSKAIQDLAVRARNKKLKIEDMQHGTFTVNNTGALGAVGGVSIINPPQGGILAAAAIVKRPVVVEEDGQDLIAVRSMMNLSFSFDHRLMDGGYAMGFVNAVKQKLEGWPMEYPLY